MVKSPGSFYRDFFFDHSHFDCSQVRFFVGSNFRFFENQGLFAARKTVGF